MVGTVKEIKSVEITRDKPKSRRGRPLETQKIIFALAKTVESSYDVILVTFHDFSQSKHSKAMDFALLRVS